MEIKIDSEEYRIKTLLHITSIFLWEYKGMRIYGFLKSLGQLPSNIIS